MATKKKLSGLLQGEPAQWGLRGDPFLWRKMKDMIDSHEYPNTEEQFITLLEQIYQQSTGVSFTPHDPIFVERYSLGGMSSGYVSPQFGLNKPCHCS